MRENQFRLTEVDEQLCLATKVVAYQYPNRTKLSITYPLDAGFQRMAPMRVVELQYAGELPSNRTKQTKGTLYYSLDYFVYVAVHEVIVENGEVIDSRLRIYLPMHVQKNRLIASDVSIAIGKDMVQQVQVENLEYVVETALQEGG